ncbi:MAG: FkbM family methyltransferase [Desulfobacterales bacterium]
MERRLQIVKTIAGPLKRGLFLLLVSRAYRKSDQRAHGWIKAIGRRWSESQHNGRRPPWIYEWLLDCTLDAQQKFFRRHFSDPLDLGTAPIGFENLRIRCTSGNSNSSSIYLFGRERGGLHFDAYRRFARPGTCAVDVGANLGIHALVLAACVGDSGKVHAFEPLPSICTRLAENLKLNAVSNVELHREALGSMRGDVAFDANTSDFNIGKGRVTPQGNITVPIGTLDDRLSSETLPVSMIKIDTEGHELEVLKGGVNLIESQRPVLVMEFNPGEYTLRDIRNRVPQGYAFFELVEHSEKGVKPIGSRLHHRCDLLIAPHQNLRG